MIKKDYLKIFASVLKIFAVFAVVGMASAMVFYLQKLILLWE